MHQHPVVVALAPGVAGHPATGFHPYFAPSISGVHMLPDKASR